MKRNLAAIVVASVAALGTTHQDAPQFRATVVGVGVHVIVRSSGRPVRDLKPDDFLLTDSRVRQDIVAVDAATVPLDVSMVVQESMLMEWLKVGTFDAEMKAIAKYLGPEDQLRIILAGDDQREEAFPIQRDLSAPAKLEARCRPVYDALARALMRPTRADRHHVVVLISVGEGTGSFLSAETVTDIAKRSNATVYTIGIEQIVGRTSWIQWVSSAVCPELEMDWTASRQARLRAIEATPSPFEIDRLLWLEGKTRLAELARLTGGDEIRPTVLTQSNTGPLLKALEEVRAGYILRYTPKGVPDTGWHPIAVTIARSGKYEVQARQGYQR